MKARPLFFALLFLGLVADRRAEAQHSPKITGDTRGLPCDVRNVAASINAWFVAMSIGDTLGIRRLAGPTFVVFSAGRRGLPETPVRADSVEQLVRYVAIRHRMRDHWSLLELRLGPVHGSVIGFMPVLRRSSQDPHATQGLWLGKAEYACGGGVRVLNLAP